VPTVLFLGLAVLAAAAQLVVAFFVHMAVRGHETPSGWKVPATKTYMQAYAVSEVALTVVIVALAVIVAIALYGRAERGLSGAGRIAWSVSALTAVIGALAFVSLFGVGVCLLLACATVPRPRRARVGGGPVLLATAGFGVG
jgi:hypothetical protein